MKHIKRKLINLYNNSYKVRRDIAEFTLMLVVLCGLVSIILGAFILLVKLVALGYGWLIFLILGSICSFCCLSVVWDDRKNKY